MLFSRIEREGNYPCYYDDMDANKKKAAKGMIKETLKALESNNMEAAFVETKEELLTLIKMMIGEGAYTASGGSMTLIETGVMDYLKNHTDYHEDKKDAYNAAFYLVSANAITMHGEIYEVDARSNRVSAMLYGPEKVIVIAGINKIVTDLHAAVERVKTEAAPANAIRLARNTPCAKKGSCVYPLCSDSSFGADGCATDERICSNTVIFSRQSVKNRIAVIIVGEDLGY